MKNRIMRLVSAAGFAAALTIATARVAAQDNNANADAQGQAGGRRNRGGGGGGGGQGGPGGGNFDPEAMRQRMNERMKEQFGVKDDAEWKLISERVEKVNEARREVGGGRGMMGMMGGRGGPGGPGGGGPGGAAPDAAGGAGGGRRGGFGGTPSPEQESLQKAIDANAPADEIKGKLAKYRTSQKDKQAKLEKSQEDLRQVLSVKQEAQAVLMGLLK